jgi:subtilisin family serine protease
MSRVHGRRPHTTSRGPNPSVPGVIKPDLTGPGVDILAAWTSQAAQPAPIVGVPVPVIGLPPTDTTPEYGMMSGTSMSSPHLAGAAALLVAMHPDWSPAAIQSALMTTAFDGSQPMAREVRGPVKQDGATPADPFDVGADARRVPDAGGELGRRAHLGRGDDHVHEPGG